MLNKLYINSTHLQKKKKGIWEKISYVPMTPSILSSLDFYLNSRLVSKYFHDSWACQIISKLICLKLNSWFHHLPTASICSCIIFVLSLYLEIPTYQLLRPEPWSYPWLLSFSYIQYPITLEISPILSLKISWSQPLFTS